MIVSKNDFEFEYIIGRGGFGKVWQVTMKKTNKKYALKEMSKVKIIDRRSEKSIKGERDFLSILRHPFIVNMNCAFQDDENLYLVMDLLTGGDLRYHLCKIRRFSEDETKFFIACLLLGLEYIHNNNIIHRDIKPENLVCDNNGYVRITDFGVAKIWKENNSEETSGTPGYMAPEVLMGKNHSFPVDFFAIGIMGYEFVFGQRPYIGKNRKEIKHLIFKKQAKIDENQIPDGWNLESVDFINQCLKRKDTKRLGYNKGIIELKSHSWFKDFDWEGLSRKEIQAPFVPKKCGNFDKKYCEEIEKVSDTTIERYQSYMNKKNFKSIFQGYTYANIQLIQTKINETTTTSKSNNIFSTKTLSSVNSQDKKNIKMDNNNINNDIQINYKDIKSKNKNHKTFNTFINNKIIFNNNDKQPNLNINLVEKINYCNLLSKKKQKKPKSTLNILSKESSILSLENYINYSKQKRLKSGSLKTHLNMNKEDLINRNSSLSNLSNLEPTTCLYRNNFKKIGENKEIIKKRSSSTGYSPSNNLNNISDPKGNINSKLFKKNKITLDIYTINTRTRHFKSSFSNKNKDHVGKIIFNEKFSQYGKMSSPKNLKKDNLKFIKEFNGIKKNKMNYFFFPKVLSKDNLSPSHKDKMRLKGNLILENIKYLSKKPHKNLHLDFSKNSNRLINENRQGFITLKRTRSTLMLKTFMDINNRINSNKNQIDNTNNNNNIYSRRKIRKKTHNNVNINDIFE